MHTLENSWSGGRKRQKEKKKNNCNMGAKGYDGQVTYMLCEHNRGR